MEGLILKDFFNLKKQAKIYFGIIAFYLVISIFSGNISFLGGFMFVISTTIPLSLFVIDEKNNFDVYAVTMPIKRRDIVCSRYITSFLVTIIPLIITLIFGMFVGKAEDGNFYTTLLLWSIALTMMAIILPFMIKFGSSKGRIIMMAILLIPTGLIVILGKIFESNLTVVNPSVVENFIGSIALIGPIFGVICMIISYVISARIFEKKEI